MANQLLPLQAGTLMTGVCFASEQERLNAYMSVSNALLAAGQSFYNYGDTKPAVNLQGYPWFRTTDGRWYFFQGVWKSPLNLNTFERRLFVGSLSDLETYDGGDTGTPSAVSGPTWIVDEEFAGRSPMGPGAIPASNPATTLNVATNAGEGAHTQTIAELVPHDHPPREGFTGFLGYVAPGEASSYEIEGGDEVEQTGGTGLTGGGQAFNVTHPVRGCWIIRWNGIRQFYVVP